MSGLDALLLLVAGLGAGLTGSIAGLASLISYPALLAVGLSPVSANVTNTVALVGSAAGSIHGSRPELRGQSIRLRKLAPAGLAGGAAGAALLLVTPAGAFARAVPWLIAVASAAILRQPRGLWARTSAASPTMPATPTNLRSQTTPGSQTAPASRVSQVEAPSPDSPESIVGSRSPSTDPHSLSLLTFVVAVYGGYFGAAAGVLLLAVLLAATGEVLARANATKNVVLGLANFAAAIGFAAFGPVHWMAVPPLAAGFLVGGRLGPVIVRRVPARWLRLAVGLAGLGLAIHLGLDAY